MAITVEELEIIIEAKVDKVMPQIEKLVSNIKRELQDSNIDFSSISKQINVETNKAKPIIQKLKNEFNPDELDPEFVKKINSMKPTIKGISNEYTKLTRQIKETGVESQKISRPTTNKQEYAPYVTAGERLNETKQEVAPTTKSFSLWDTLRGKITQIKSVISEVKADWKSTDGVLGQTRQKLQGIGQAILKVGKMSASLLGIKKNADAMKNTMSQGIKQVLRYAGALIGIRSIYNGLKSLASEWMSSNDTSAKQLSANLNYMKMAIGSSLKPVIEFIINLIYKAVSAVQSLVYALSGVNIFSKMTADNYKKMASGASSASKATKQLAGIHNEINNISDSDSGGGGSSTPNIDLSKVNTKMSDWFKQSLSDAYMFGYNIGQKINDGLRKIDWASIQSTVVMISTNVAKFLNGLNDGIDWNLIGYTIGQGLNTIFLSVYTFLKEFDFKKFGNAMGKLLINAIDTIDWSLLSGILSEKIKGILDIATGVIEEIDWHVIIDAILEFIRGIDFSGIADSFFGLLGTALGKLVELGIVIGEYIGKAIDSAKQYFQDKIEECGGNIVLGILKGIGDAVLGIGQWIYDHIFTPFINGFKNAFGIHSPSTVMAEMGKFIVEGIFNGISSLIGNVIQIWDKFKNDVVNKITDLKNKAIITINNLKDDTINKFENIKSSVVTKVTNLKANAINIFNNLRSGISSTIGNIKSTIVNGFDSAVNHIKSLPSQALTWGKDIIGNVVNGIRSKIGEITGAMTDVANRIRAFIHFSEPDKGPLSDFHTYMPDMIALMKQGIQSNMGSLMTTVENMAQGMYTTLNPDNLLDYSVTAKINSNGLQAFGFRDVVDEIASNEARLNSNNQQRLTVQIGGKTIFDETIDYINAKTRRTGKAVIKVE